MWYVAYVTFMKFNENIEHFVKRLINGATVNNKLEEAKDDAMGKNNQVSRSLFDLSTVCQRSSQYNRRMSAPLLHGGSKFRQGVLQLMIHSIDPLYEEPVSMAMKNGQVNEFVKDHIHPPGAAHCPLCGEEKHGVKVSTNGVFHTSKALMSDRDFGANTVTDDNDHLPEEAVIGTHKGNLPPQDSTVSGALNKQLWLHCTCLCSRSRNWSRWMCPGPIRFANK